MDAKIVKSDSTGITLQVTIPYTKDMLTTEESIQQWINEAGLLATQHALSVHDTDGTPIKVGEKKYTSKGQLSKTYQCPFGEFELCRHVYQSNTGGITYCPLDNDARIIVFSTPKFAKMVSSKYSNTGSSHVQKDLHENHGRFISRTYIRDISRAVGEFAISKEKEWEYDIPVEPSDVSTIGISLDGTCMLLREDGWRQAMVGSISYYGSNGERLYTSYIAHSPEYGKETFYKDLTGEIYRARKKYPDKKYVGVADGASDNWTFLKSFVQEQVLDFFHVSEYLAKVSKAAFVKRKSEGQEWLNQACHTLKHETGGANILLEDMKNMLKKKITDEKKEEINTAITYFNNHISQMNYAGYLSEKIPIGSGIIEAACKVIIKQRMCNSGMRWTDAGAKNILVLRCFNETDGKWEQFWKKINKIGFNIK
jgi:hypothetical protein